MTTELRRPGRTGRWRTRVAGGLAIALAVPAAIFVVAPETLFDGYDRAAKTLDAFVEAGRRRPDPASPAAAFAAVALVAQEDRRIFERRLGDLTVPWDLRACGRALVRNLTSAGIREGCSTLAMQLAKLAMPTAAGRRLLTKLMQLRLAWRTASASPETIVSAYLQVLPCASAYARGLDACALLRFGRPPDRLTPAEAIVLAAAVQAPGRDLQATEAALDRARARLGRVLSAAVELEMITSVDAEVILRQPVELQPPDLDQIRARRAGRDPALTERLAEAVAAARAHALGKLGTEDDEDLVVAGALYDADGRLRAQIGEPAWFHQPVDAGSWVKPFVVEALIEAGVGRDYLSGSIQVPLHVPLVTRDGQRWHPRNAVPLEDHAAVPMMHVMRSVNTGTLASLLYAFVYLPPSKSRALLARHLSPEEQARFSSPLDRALSLEMASSYAGVALHPEDTPDLPGYRQISLGATRMVLEQMRARVPELEVPHEDLAALLGVVRAPAEALAQGLRGAWLRPDGQLTPTASLMAEYSRQGTLRWLGPATPAVYKTATADRNAGLVALAFDRCSKAPLQLLLIALRPSGRPITPIQGATLGPGYRALLSACLRPSTEEINLVASDTYATRRPNPDPSEPKP